MPSDNFSVKRSGNDKLINKPIDIVYKSSGMCDERFEEHCISPGFKKLITNSVPTLNLPGKYIILILCVETYDNCSLMTVFLFTFDRYNIFFIYFTRALLRIVLLYKQIQYIDHEYPT